MIKKELTREEEADEIIRRLKTKPTRRLNATWTLDDIDNFNVSEELMHELTKQIAKEIDEELIKNLISYVKRET